MRHNIFDSIPSDIVSGKDNVFANFLQTAGLYESMKIDEDNIEELILFCMARSVHKIFTKN